MWARSRVLIAFSGYSLVRFERLEFPKNSISEVKIDVCGCLGPLVEKPTSPPPFDWVSEWIETDGVARTPHLEITSVERSLTSVRSSTVSVHDPDHRSVELLSAPHLSRIERRVLYLDDQAGRCFDVRDMLFAVACSVWTISCHSMGNRSFQDRCQSVSDSHQGSQFALLLCAQCHALCCPHLAIVGLSQQGQWPLCLGWGSVLFPLIIENFKRASPSCSTLSGVQEISLDVEGERGIVTLPARPPHRNSAKAGWKKPYQSRRLTQYSRRGQKDVGRETRPLGFERLPSRRTCLTPCPVRPPARRRVGAAPPARPGAGAVTSRPVSPCGSRRRAR